MKSKTVFTPTDESGFVTFDPLAGTTTQGEPMEVAFANLQEATKLYLEEFSGQSA
jgi:predicted RNase H-like HicB family nuclease